MKGFLPHSKENDWEKAKETFRLKLKIVFIIYFCKRDAYLAWNSRH